MCTSGRGVEACCPRAQLWVVGAMRGAAGSDGSDADSDFGGELRTRMLLSRAGGPGSSSGAGRQAALAERSAGGGGRPGGAAGSKGASRPAAPAERSAGAGGRPGGAAGGAGRRAELRLSVTAAERAALIACLEALRGGGELRVATEPAAAAARPSAAGKAPRPQTKAPQPRRSWLPWWLPWLLLYQVWPSRGGGSSGKPKPKAGKKPSAPVARARL